MNNRTTIACVTGASGMIGRRIVRHLIGQGYRTRVLSRGDYYTTDPRVEVFRAGLEDEEVLRSFVLDAHLLFHCAAELHDESKMWEVNVLGTERLLRFVKESRIQYLCYLSSAGVVGPSTMKWVDEKTNCMPQNAYEQSKWAAEQLVAQGIDGCRIVILRPTNVMDEERPGALSLPMRASWLDRIKVVLKGGECAHIVHAENVAEAAMHFVSRPFTCPRCFFVSCDHEPLNTFAGLWALYRALENEPSVSSESVRPVGHLPLIVPHMLRRLWRGQGERGDTRYSSQKLISEGFIFPLGVEDTVKQLISTLRSK
jgi:nucleoside-diphosphate-sugar epimerase